jgi:hypothetical protein
VALKKGTEDRKKVAIAGSLALVVLMLAAKTIFGGPDVPPATGPQPAPVSANPAPASRTSSSRTAAEAGEAVHAGSGASAASMDPTLHPELMAENESFLYTGSGRNIFSQNSAPATPLPIHIEKLRAPIRPSETAAAPPTGLPPPPAIDLRFFGYAAKRDGSRNAFLLHGDDVFIASEGDVVSHRYKVVRIQPASILVEDLPYNDTQSLPLVLN